VVQDATYYPWGQLWQSPGSFGGNWNFAAFGVLEPTTNLYPTPTRRYAVSYSRWLTPDPLMASAKVWDPQTWNRYGYARSNPLALIDPTGMDEVTSADCAKDSRCVTVRVNVIFDKNANNGQGLTEQQKADFEKKQLQNAKDEYGDANIHLDVTYTAGGLSVANGRMSATGLQAGALNVIVTDQADAMSVMPGKVAVSLVNANSTDQGDLAHEMAHQFMGDTQGVTAWACAHDPTRFLNAAFDVANDAERAWMRTLDSRAGPFSYYPLASAFHHNAAVFQKSIQPTTKPQ